MFGFLFWLFLIGIIVASLQDVKRREIDNWLNLFLVFAGFAFIFYRAVFEGNTSLIFQFGFALVVLFVLSNLFYEGRVFAGGDAKLLFAMTALFVGVSFYVTLINIGTFVFFLMLGGSIYGLIYSLISYYKNFDKVNGEMKNGFGKLWVRLLIISGALLFTLSYFDWMFLFVSVLVLLLPVLFVFAKALEKVSMVRVVGGRELREGDWLVDDIKVKGKVIKADWDGLSSGDVRLLKEKKKVNIKEGLPFAPAFLIAFLGYVFLRSWFFGLLVGLG